MKPTGHMSSSSASSLKPPAFDELEVSVFGPGRGESIVAHVGGGHWIVVDSCIDRKANEPVAIKYLKSLKLDISSAIKLVVATHWDVDHVRGLSKVFEAAKAAAVVFSSAERGPLLFQAMETARRSRISDIGFSEYARIFDLLAQRRRPGQPTESVSPKWAVEGLCLHTRAAETGLPEAKVIALSPSHNTSTLEIRDIEFFLPTVAKPQRRPISHKPNARSVVIWVQVGGRRVLLGGDLEASSNPAVGWQAVVAAYGEHQLDGRAGILKSPHHGSKTADSFEMWNRLTEPDPHIFVAPFAGQSKGLPSDLDIARLKEKTAHLYLCANPRGWRGKKRAPAVEKTIRELTGRSRLTAVRGNVGHIQARCSIADSSQPINVNCFSPARKY